MKVSTWAFVYVHNSEEVQIFAIIFKRTLQQTNHQQIASVVINRGEELWDKSRQFVSKDIFFGSKLSFRHFLGNQAISAGEEETSDCVRMRMCFLSYLHRRSGSVTTILQFSIVGVQAKSLS